MVQLQESIAHDNQIQQKKSGITKRYQGLDALRAIARLLGILLHGLMSFIPLDAATPAQDIFQSETFEILLTVIHGFPVQLFFVLSGFFTTKMWRKRGWGA